MQQLHGTRRDRERLPAIVGDSERHAATPWDRERQPATMGDSERHAAVLRETASDHGNLKRHGVLLQ